MAIKLQDPGVGGSSADHQIFADGRELIFLSRRVKEAVESPARMRSRLAV